MAAADLDVVAGRPQQLSHTGEEQLLFDMKDQLGAPVASFKRTLLPHADSPPERLVNRTWS